MITSWHGHLIHHSLSSIYFLRVRCQICSTMFHHSLDIRLWKRKGRIPAVDSRMYTYIYIYMYMCTLRTLWRLRRKLTSQTKAVHVTHQPQADHECAWLKKFALQSAKIARPSQTTTANMQTNKCVLHVSSNWKWWPQRVLEAALNAICRIPWSGTQEVNHRLKQLFWLCAFWRGVCCQTVVAGLVRHGQTTTYHNLTSRKEWCLVRWHV